METTLNQVNLFTSRTKALRDSQFILAPQKLTDLMRSIASSPLLVEFFSACVEPFDYLSAQEKYLIPDGDNPAKAHLLLPENQKEKIAFLFCLLTDLESNNIDFNAFLNTFFGESDGYAQAFERFKAAVVLPFERETATLLLNADMPPILPISDRGNQVENILFYLTEERQNVLYVATLSDTARSAGVAMLEECLSAFKQGKIGTAQALLLGYYYFALHEGISIENTQKLFELMEAL